MSWDVLVGEEWFRVPDLKRFADADEQAQIVDQRWPSSGHDDGLSLS
jgi:hypothetical protein